MCNEIKFGYFYLNRTSGGRDVFRRSQRKNSRAGWEHYHVPELLWSSPLDFFHHPLL